jgi:hypothetical protein
LAKPPVTQLLKNFSNLCKTQSFITDLTLTRNLSVSWTRLIQFPKIFIFIWDTF